MASKDTTGTVDRQAGDQHGRPPTRPTYRAVQGLFVLALLYTLYLAKTLLVPIVFALMLTLLLGPAVKFLRRYHIPRPISAIGLLLLLTVPFTLLGMEMSQPAQKWAENLPELSERFTQQIGAMTSTLGGGGQAVDEEEMTADTFFSRLFGGEEEAEEALEVDEPNRVMEQLTQGGIELMLYVLAATPVFFAQVITCISLTVFLLVFGSRLFESIITNVPQIQDKKGAHHLVDIIEQQLSRYVLTVSAINALLGFTTAAVFWVLGVEDAVFWGVLVGMLNFAPYVGTIIGLSMLSLAGLVQYGMEWMALMPALVYLVINGLEAQVVTPLVLGKHMRLNPLILLTWLVIWGWLWGFVGVLLAVPLLVCVKLAVSQLSESRPWVRIIETRY